MKQTPSDKHTIAWFKLAEFVSRGEKEKALGIYKLLVLSINDLAFNTKLEGDILFSFNDKGSIEKYYKAAVLYQKDERYIESITIFENLLTIDSNSIEYLNKLYDLYLKLDIKEKAVNILISLFKIYLDNLQFKEALITLQQTESFKEENELLHLYENLTFSFIKNNFDSKITFTYLNKIVDIYLKNKNKLALNQFLMKIENLNQQYYNELIKLIEKEQK